MRKTEGNQISGHLRARSANTYHTSHHNRFRVDDNESYNRLKTSIKNAFDVQNKVFADVKQLTSRVSPAQSQKINRICVKYSICPNPKKAKQRSEDVDVQFIARAFVRSKSRERKKEDQKKELRESIKIVSRRYEQPREKEFFKLECENLRQLDLHAHNEAHQKQSHPYLKIYQKTQAEALANILHRNNINIGSITDCPSLGEPESWEKDQKQIKQMYATIKTLRSQNNKLRQRKHDNSNDTFYLT